MQVLKPPHRTWDISRGHTQAETFLCGQGAERPLGASSGAWRTPALAPYSPPARQAGRYCGLVLKVVLTFIRMQLSPLSHCLQLVSEQQ